MLWLLSQLRNERPKVPAGAVSGVLLALEQRAGHGVVRSVLIGKRLALYGGVAVAVLAASAATTVLALGRSRTPKAARAAGSPARAVGAPS